MRLKSITGKKSTMYRGSMACISVIALFLLVFTHGCGGRETGERMKVATTIYPLTDFCRIIGGELVEVETLVPSGASPHTFEPTSEQMKFVSEADVFIVNGLDLQFWASGVLSKVGKPEVVDVVAGDAVPKQELLPAGEHEGEGDQDASTGSDEGPYNPHVWLDPLLAIYQVEAIRDGLMAADPGHSDTYRENAERYIERLRRLDIEIGERTAEFSKREFISYHPAWAYFARRYRLREVAAVEEIPGKEPGAGEIAALVDTIRDQDIPVIFVEPQFDPRAADVIASEAGEDVVVVKLDPLGNPDDPRVDTYLKMMRHNVEAMAEALE